MTRRALLCALGLLCATAHAATLDNFRARGVWKASASEGVQAELRRAADGSLCLHADFRGVAGQAVMRRALTVRWPAHFDLAVDGSGGGGAHALKLRFLDAGGRNAWTARRDDQRLADTWRIRARQLEPSPGAAATPRETQAAELVLEAGPGGGAGHVCLRELQLVPRKPEPAAWPEPLVQVRGSTIEADLRAWRDMHGVLLTWPASVRQREYTLQAMTDGGWRTLRRVRGGPGAVDAVFTPELEVRRLRIVASRPLPAPAVALRDARQWPDRHAVLRELAAALPRGDLPRGFLGELPHRTLVGVDGGGPRSALVDEDGAVELGAGGPSLVPAVLMDDGQRITWADVQATQRLRDGTLPLPVVAWRHPALSLTMHFAADGPREAPRLLARYVLRNEGSVPRRFTLQLALRPWQVAPPPRPGAAGGLRRVRSLQWADGQLVADGRALLRPAEAPQAVRAAGWDGGFALATLATAPRLARFEDPESHASAALQWQLDLPPGAAATVAYSAALAEATALPAADAAAVTGAMEEVAAAWSARLGRLQLQVPPTQQAVADAVRAAHAQLLLSRDGAALRAGTRTERRTRIADGALIASALLRLGEPQAARDFIDEFAPRVAPSGQVPCCVDERGADPAAGLDSAGQFLHLATEAWRHGAGRGWLQRHWPLVQRVVEQMERQRRAGKGGFAGTQAQGFWALRGYKDAVAIARALGAEAEATRWQAAQAEFEQALRSSLVAAARRRDATWLPAAPERAEPDPAATALALDPAEAGAAVLPPMLLEGTFDRYAAELRERAEGRRPWREVSLAEWRNVGALLRLGRVEDARVLTAFLMSLRRPAGWPQWPDVVPRRERDVAVAGDVPNAVAAAEFVRAALDLFAYTREEPAQIVIGAGLDGPPVVLRGLRTEQGPLDWSLRAEGELWQLEVARAGAPVRLAWPHPGPLPQALHEGRELDWQGRELPLPPAPATITLRFPATEAPR